MAELAEITDDEWRAITARLTLYAVNKMRRLCWRGCRPVAWATGPGGFDPNDLAATAIERVLDGSRTWDNEADPFEYLCSVLDSIVSHLANGWENQHQRMMPQHRGGDAVARSLDPPCHDLDPAQIVADEEETNGIRIAVREVVVQDPLALTIFDCLQAGFHTPAEIAEIANVEVEQIYTAKRRLERAVNGVLNKNRKPVHTSKGARNAKHS